MANAKLACHAPIPHSRWNLPVRSPRRLTPQLLLAATLCSLGSGAFADLPLSVESILTDKGKTKLNLSLSYRNQGMAERDERVVKQDLDYSCGAASLATLLNGHYDQNLTEQDLLQAMDLGDLMASFEDMQRALLQFGFRAAGFSTDYEQLTKLKMPGIVYLEHRKSEHFSVLRGIDKSTVWLADPSLGNRTYSREQFLDMWETRTNESENPELKGKVLVVFPADGKSRSLSDFFTKRN